MIKTNETLVSRGAPAKAGAIFGLYIADALAMPVHWYYNTAALERDYGYVTDYMAPKNPHPDSILWRSSYQAANAKGEILHDQAKYWGQRGVHYHQFLKAGENTLNLKLCSLLIDSLAEKGGYDADDWLARYIDFMTTSGNHADTYVEEYHRHFFTGLASGKPANECGVPEKHISGLIPLAPIALFYADDPETARKAAREHLRLTHLGERMAHAADLFVETLLRVVAGERLAAVLRDGITRQGNPYLGHPFEKWAFLPDEAVVAGKLSTACYVEYSIPAVVYLALKYADDPETALIVNTNLGGENAGRGSVLGALLGADAGVDAWPERWRNGLLHPPRLDFLKISLHTAQKGDQ